MSIESACQHNPRRWVVLYGSYKKGGELEALEFKCSVCGIDFWLAIETKVLIDKQPTE